MDQPQQQQQPNPLLTTQRQSQKPQKPPKPGSKRAQLLKTQQQLERQQTVAAAQSIAPTFQVHERVLVLLFANAASLKAALGRPHTEYEGGHLKGPLKGINFPTALLDDWASRTSDITECEEAVLAIVGSKDMDGADSGNSDCSARPLYVIAGLANDPSTLLHEWAHARFFLDEQFRAVCTAEWNQLEPDVRLAIERELAMRNYKPDVFIDEFQAYVCESSEDFGRRWSHKLRLPHTRLRSLLNLPETLK